MSTAAEVVALTIEEELQIIPDMHDGAIPPAAVVDYARDPDTALHSRFTWDDGEAAEQHRLWQARQVMRVYVKMDMPNRSPVNVRAFVSLPSDRRTGNGYRSLNMVIKNEERCSELLAMAKSDLRTFRNKYRVLSELASVFSEIDKVLS
jgi:hypothetical protein